MKIDATAEDVSPLTVAAARAEFDADLTYLDTAAFGLPPRRSWMALQEGVVERISMRSMAYSLTTCGPFSAYHAAFPITLIGNQIE